MRHVFTAENLAEAHMIAHQLERAGIAAHVHGEALQGAVGELQAGSLRVAVAEEDVERAEALLAQWKDTPEEIARKIPKFPTVLVLSCFAVGIIVGFAAKTAVDSSRISVLDSDVGYDRNGDGRDDETYFTRLGENFAHKLEADRNFNGRVDLIDHYDSLGVVVGEESDDDFDGVFETTFEFRHGWAVRSQIDSNHNGVADVTNYFEHGVPRRTTYFDEREGVMARVDYVGEGGFIERAEIDLDRDGFLETVRTFDRYGEITATETRTPER